MLRRLGVKDDAVERGEFTGHGRVLGGPKHLEGLEKLVRDTPSSVEIGGADGLEFLAQPAGTHPKVNAPPGKTVHGRNGLRREHRRAARHHHHGGKDARPLRHRRYMRHQDELLHAVPRVVEQLAGDVVGVARGIALRDDNEIGHPEPHETAVLRLCGQRPDGLRGGQGTAIRDGQTEFHVGRFLLKNGVGKPGSIPLTTPASQRSQAGSSGGPAGWRSCF